MNASDTPVNLEQRSIWELNNRMPTISEQRMSSIRGSQLYSQYLSDTRQLQPYRQAWIPDETKLPNNKTTQGFTRSKKCILVTLGIGLLIVIVICAPLAVMTTLYLQEKSQSQAASTSNTDSSSTNGTNNPVVLPSQCTSYTTNDNYTRNVAYSGCANCYCDNSLPSGWYRFSGAAGTRLSTFPSNAGTCGTGYTGWFNGSLPTTVGASTNGNMCFNGNGVICNRQLSANNIMVTNCGDYYVFFLSTLSSCFYRYCTT